MPERQPDQPVPIEPLAATDHVRWAIAHQNNVWQRMRGGDGPYLHDMETRQLLMQSAQVHALLAVVDAIKGLSS